jgi:hypothetical protein
MEHDVGSFGLPEHTARHAPIDFPNGRIEPDHGDRLGSTRCVVWCFVFGVAACVAVALVWGLWRSLH